ncbi:hypothetical protein [Microbacterium sp. SORGH_AS_0888]|uniref:hypothetical protein n=1 Tax=Microbacterium sp. SORGH_AS_0888 TaxID=3041791 RepID=UPI00278A223D|nr:hypothetical protein [Microbacterium sp. SORGH_AS_0888]MDQ1131221.1 hypothetical protein [Microbacterium sp. SORGH_AS_0888]
MSEFFFSMDGRGGMEFPEELRPPREQFAIMLGLLREGKRSTFGLTPVPDGVHVLRHMTQKGPAAFLQCAGTGDELTIEWRRRDDDGQSRLYTLGHTQDHDPEFVTIEFFDGTRSTQVHPDEVFTVDEAVDIFTTYYETQAVPDRYSLREFDLTWPKP